VETVGGLAAAERERWREVGAWAGEVGWVAVEKAAGAEVEAAAESSGLRKQGLAAEGFFGAGSAKWKEEAAGK